MRVIAKPENMHQIITTTTTCKQKRNQHQNACNYKALRERGCVVRPAETINQKIKQV